MVTCKIEPIWRNLLRLLGKKKNIKNPPNYGQTGNYAKEEKGNKNPT